MLQPGQAAAARVEREPLAAARHERAGDVVQVRPFGDALIGDGVEPREGPPPGPRHVNRWPPPRRTPRPRTPSTAVMPGLPAGWPSSPSSAPSPVVIRNPAPVVRL